MTTEFLKRAQLLKHDEALLKSGQEVKSNIIVNSVEELKELMDAFSPRLEPELKSKMVFHPVRKVMATSEEHEDAMIDLQAYIYADKPLSAKARATIQAAMPASVSSISAPEKVIDKQEKIEGGQLVIWNIGHLIFKNNSSLCVYNTPFELTVDTLTIEGDSTANLGDINILGKTGSTGATGGLGGAGSTGSTGGQGSTGGTGTDGSTGGAGQPGSPGLSSMQAKINILKTIEIKPGNRKLVITTRSGTGGVGGVGGTGGAGGAGGTGGAGQDNGCIGQNGGNGGHGGNGGKGGTGGPGGPGVNAAGNIVVTFPPGQRDRIFAQKTPAPGGKGGGPGHPGGRGAGGAPGNKSNKGSSNGQTGTAGSDGAGGGWGDTNNTAGNPADITY